MKELYIVRHGKSSWNIDNISDIDRSLKERGVVDGYTMAERLKNKSIIPDKIISSPATRALHSAMIFTRTFNISLENLVINKDIYHAEYRSMINIIRNTDDEIKSLMIFGHNPTFTDLANYFVDNKIDNLPTTGIVGIKFKTEKWNEIEKSDIMDWFFDYPKNI